MRPVTFGAANCVYAKNQPQYLPLPAYRSSDGLVITCWRLSLWERVVVLFGGNVWLNVLTFNQPLQPQKPSIDCPLLIGGGK